MGELLGINGEAIEFEWNIFPGFTSLQILQEIQDDLQKRNSEPEKFTDRIIFMSMFNDIDWTRKGNEIILFFEFRKSQGKREKILAGTLGRFLVPETKRSGMESAKKTWNKVEFSSFTDGTSIQGN